MIGQVRGFLEASDASIPHLRVGDWLFEVRMLQRDIEQSRLNPGQIQNLWTHLFFKEEKLEMFGFFHQAERDWFRKLIKISSVGGKLALAILDNLGIDEMVMAVHLKEASVLSKVPGVGKRLASKLILELERLVQDWQSLQAQSPQAWKREITSLQGEVAQAKQLQMQHLQACLQALSKLGYREHLASPLIQEVQRQHQPTQLSELIRLVLQRIDRPRG